MGRSQSNSGESASSLPVCYLRLNQSRAKKCVVLLFIFSCVLGLAADSKHTKSMSTAYRSYSKFRIVRYLIFASRRTAIFVVFEASIAAGYPRSARFPPSTGALRQSNTRRSELLWCCFSTVHRCSARSALIGANRPRYTLEKYKYCSRVLRRIVNFQNRMVQSRAW